MRLRGRGVRPVSLDPEQLGIARDEMDRLKRARPTRDPKALGCLVAFAGMIVLTLTPAVGGWLDIPPGLALGILAAAILLLAGGAVVGLVGGGRQQTKAAAARRESLVVLDRWARGSGTEAEAIRAAVRYLQAGGGLLVEGAAGVAPAARALIDRVARASLGD